MTPLKKNQYALVAGGVCIIALAGDVFTKWWILNVVMIPPRVMEIAPFFNLALGFNSGISFGLFRDLFQEHPLVLVGIKLLIILGLLVWARRIEKLWDAVALGLMAGGAAGNVVDRLKGGAVTDFLDFHIGAWHWPAFNFADAAITTGVALFLVSAFSRSRPGQKVPDRA